MINDIENAYFSRGIMKKIQLKIKIKFQLESIVASTDLRKGKKYL